MKWYVGAQKPYSNPRVGVVFPYSGKVTEKKFGRLFGYVFGGYSSRKEAIDVSNYQGFCTVASTYKILKKLMDNERSGKAPWSKYINFKY